MMVVLHSAVLGRHPASAVCTVHRDVRLRHPRGRHFPISPSRNRCGAWPSRPPSGNTPHAGGHHAGTDPVRWGRKGHGQRDRVQFSGGQASRGIEGTGGVHGIPCFGDRIEPSETGSFHDHRPRRTGRGDIRGLIQGLRRIHIAETDPGKGSLHAMGGCPRSRFRRVSRRRLMTAAAMIS